VSSGKDHTLILTTNGLVYGFGQNSKGQLGVVSEHSSSITPLLIEDISHIPMKFVAAGSFSASIAQETGSLYLWGTGTFGAFKTPHRVKKIEGRAMQCSIGESFGIVLTEDRQMYTWGQNYNGQLGSGDLIDKPTPQEM
jgi:alpha-tubulin suppressor-like RCC1 family protein